MWFIHGKTYDLTDFLDKHPGGSTILESCRGISDATACFESYHALVDMNRVSQMMIKYETSNAPLPVQNFSFKKNGFYYKLKKKVRDKFRKINTKWTKTWLCVALVTFLVYVTSFYISFCTNQPQLVKLATSILAGSTLMQLLFQVGHDASHQAISKNKYVNENLAKIFFSLAYWDYFIWTKHHSVLHHAFTGLPKDPDMRHSEPFFAKLKSMFVGLVISYCVGKRRKHLWGFSIPNNNSHLQNWITVLQTCLILYGSDFLITVAFFLTLNLNYSIAILPNHDLEATRLNKQISDDWGEMQVRNSANFCTNNKVLTHLYGGINFQIEHHCFPTLSSSHLPKIQGIVKKLCYENGIRYVESASVFKAYWNALTSITLLNSKI